MAMDPASISAISALAGSFIGALASVTTSWFTHHSQSRSERFKQEAARREQLFGALVDQASQAYADGVVCVDERPLRDRCRLVPKHSPASGRLPIVPKI